MKYKASFEKNDETCNGCPLWDLEWSGCYLQDSPRNYVSKEKTVKNCPLEKIASVVKSIVANEPYCPECRMILDVEWQHCPFCGIELDWETTNEEA